MRETICHLGQPKFEPFDGDELKLPPTDVEVIMLKRGKNMYSTRLGHIDEIGIEVGGKQLFWLVSLYEDELASDEPILGTPSCYIDYSAGQFRVWPTPDRNIEMVVFADTLPGV
jgi:hypothetical protein